MLPEDFFVGLSKTVTEVCNKKSVIAFESHGGKNLSKFMPHETEYHMVDRKFQPWKQDKMGNYYQGEVDSKGRADGWGVLVGPGYTGVVVGYWKEHALHGQATVYRDGDKWEGPYDNGARHGDFSRTYLTGKSFRK